MPMSLESGLAALKQERYKEAVQLLENFCQNCFDTRATEYMKAQMALVKAYGGSGQTDRAIALCQELVATSENAQVRTWAEQALQAIASKQPATARQASRASVVGTKLAMAKVGGNLTLASGVTLSLLFGMVLVLSLAVVLIYNSDDPKLALAIGVGLTLIFNTIGFFL